ncbi:23S rRNA (guanosine(2251)-2'-O)-methyltransferase RlmB [Anaerococcus degeneri]|uniref:23S rRNA (Guanosine(2251)-2'-O)-methyltransferase RlmB n=1 Tax=Anaerococcus degeneri TaxID=361500 RepID=A0ABS7YWM4_9FIRM|nr:23S rRNA (guanosine(2251)-2'-O)-methyltransferase RlmB [Anaerococcus degeneri]MBP2015245.1 23S rRNA (guanosine2251-2'-O)-methyltransferase [Anaerococcus degeneri]MCA2096141.1 23S rRNA (guanosine(2251)-2'-O)-methyltransferase RlmB [Anaerococcus degeneri]
MDKIYGRKPVIDAIDSGVKIYKAFVIKQNSKIVDEIISKLNRANVEINFVDKRFFDKIDMNHQGVMVEAESFQYKDLSDISKYQRLIILDQIEDPHNLGAIIRSAESFGFDGVIIPERRSASVSPIVYKTSAGAINNINIIMVKNINRAIEEIKEAGFWVYGLAGEASSPIDQVDLKGKVCLIVGNEGKGLSRLVRENCDILINIPMKGFVNSLNASVASAIAMYEVLRQNGFN